ncbi:class I SAM-dependent methyltransferase [Flavobacterium filum]|mgnify:CR=1 FL=1|uniref:class I SAM-dependent methyltransferase n=1 Tax=Flavobacterium filum TaxID=370974 RepID=UPI0023F06EA4|nr:class I SAM-dependent methyltransferase [Flavobacterium filum]
MENETSLVSVGDFLDVYYKVKQKGFLQLASLFNLTKNKRVSAKWNQYQSSSDFWIIPALQQYWNNLISGNPEVSYESYVIQKYLHNKTNLSLLSIGCGEGRHERKFAVSGLFSKVIGVDISNERIERATQTALENNLNIEYVAGDFHQMIVEKESFDVILFDSSLHHFNDINGFLKKEISPLLKTEGILVANEFCGPNRLQWKKEQLDFANELLKELPKKYKTRIDGKSVKRKVYRPGLIRMLLVDPSEAPDSAHLKKALQANFKVLEEKNMGWNILHILLKGIAHNFLNNDEETNQLLAYLIKKEEEFIERVGDADSIFGVYKKSRLE